MSGMLWAGGIALVGSFLSFLLSVMGYRGARLVSVAAALTLLLYAASGIGIVIKELGWLGDAVGISEVAAAALKIVGVGYISGICYDICLDMGERGVASAVLTVGRVEILLVVAPTVSEIMRLAVDML